MTSSLHKTIDISAAYRAANDNKSITHKPKKGSPYSIRLTAEERAYLKQKAGNRSLSRYIRTQLLGDQAALRKELRQPQLSQSQYASLLANLGASRLSANVNQLAAHANMGTLEVSSEVEQELQDACAALKEMRKALLMALGMKSGH